MSVCQNPTCGADTTGMTWCRTCGSDVVAAETSEVTRGEPDQGSRRGHRTWLYATSGAAVLVAAATGVVFALDSDSSGSADVDESVLSPKAAAVPLVGSESTPPAAVEHPTAGVPPAPKTTPQPPAGQYWEPVPGRSALLKTSVTSDAMAALIADQHSAGAIGPAGAWLTSPANGQRYLISCTPDRPASTSHVSCVEVDNEDGGDLDAGIVMLS